ncbi:MAG TPA: protein-L-isoaspartate O-methyltransferase [Spirochaetia bacterium]|nr:protein-L-isoaspartate O-methyltransferase [Spirochaetia bacterium]
MAWEQVLGEHDLRVFKANADLLVEQVRERFDHGQSGVEILAAIGRVPRHRFVSEAYRSLAYTDKALPTIGELTTSAPSVIAEMIFLSGARKGDLVLEVGTGSGYESALLSEMGIRLHSIEIDEEVALAANHVLVSLGYKHDKTAEGRRGIESLARYHRISRSVRHRGIVDLYIGNAVGGLPELAPFKGIIVAAAVERIDPLAKLIDQLSPDGGSLVVPVGAGGAQRLRVITRVGSRTSVTTLPGPSVSFIPLQV